MYGKYPSRWGVQITDKTTGPEVVLSAESYSEAKIRLETLDRKDSERRRTAELKNNLEGYIYSTKEKVWSPPPCFILNPRAATPLKAELFPIYLDKIYRFMNPSSRLAQNFLFLKQYIFCKLCCCAHLIQQSPYFLWCLSLVADGRVFGAREGFYRSGAKILCREAWRSRGCFDITCLVSGGGIHLVKILWFNISSAVLGARMAVYGRGGRPSRWIQRPPRLLESHRGPNILQVTRLPSLSPQWGRPVLPPSKRYLFCADWPSSPRGRLPVNTLEVISARSQR